MLLDDLVAAGMLASTDMQRLTSQRRNKIETEQHPLNYIAEQQFENRQRAGHKLSIAALLSWLAECAAQPVRHIDPMKVDVREVTAVMSFAFAKRHQILALEVDDEQVVIASAQPFITGWEEDLAHALKKPIVRVVADPADIARYSVEFYSLVSSVSGAVGGASSSVISNFEQMLELGKLKDPDANDQHIVNIVDWLLQYAFDQRASDIHIEPRREQGNIRFRIDGVLCQIYELPPAVINAVTSRLKILARMDLAEKRRPQDGRIKTMSPDGVEVELRLATMPTAFGEKLVMRIFDPDVLLRSFENLGLVDDDYERWQSMTQRPNGILLVTGPTGSGKTTTLYSTLKQLATQQVNVCTIEDPIEMVEPAFNQMQVQKKIDLDFASGVRALMRQDPDIIMVGEIRDAETAEMAVQAALTGHLVISTVHTNDAPSAVSRMLELGVPAYLIRATVIGIMAQRLVRTLCEHCKTATTIDSDVWNELTQPWNVAKPNKVFKADGCLECRNTGYYGRQGLYEILPLSRDLSQLVVDDLNLDELRQCGMREGMRTLRLAGAKKIAAGYTTPEEVLRVTPAMQK
ncbi:GspE/PulE family protein [Pseudomonadales bacterium]|nr:GspE/PulE family protein [Pseudomonadales bacterium]MDB4542189.1 GspE/PulE family protein [Pseudomonadales bacterium]